MSAEVQRCEEAAILFAEMNGPEIHKLLCHDDCSWYFIGSLSTEGGFALQNLRNVFQHVLLHCSKATQGKNINLADLIIADSWNGSQLSPVGTIGMLWTQWTSTLVGFDSTHDTSSKEIAKLLRYRDYL